MVSKDGRVRSAWRTLLTLVNGEIHLDDAEKRNIAERDRELQREVETSWERWNDGHGAGYGDDVVGISCSGGGLRSAAFNLGALQVLQDKGVLRRAAWLSAVSGGSYIAAAHYLVQADFTTRDGVELATAPDDPHCRDGTDRSATMTPTERLRQFAEQPAFALGTPEERWLRTHSSYLADSWKTKLLLAGQVLFGAALTVACLALLLALAAIPAGIAAGAMFPDLRHGVTPATIPLTLVARSGLSLVVASLVCAFVVVGLRLQDRRRRWWRRIGAWLAVLGLLLLVLAYGLPLLLAALRTLLGAGPTADGLSATMAWWSLAGLSPLVVTAFGVLVRGARTIGPGARSRLLRRITPVLPTIVAAIAGPLLLTSMFLAIYNVAVRVEAGVGGGVWLLVLALTVVLALVVDPTAASMHTFYKRRLASAFDVIRTRNEGSTEFDQACQRDLDQLTTLSASDVPGHPKLIVGAAANVSNRGATPTGRNAVPFAFTSDWVGGDDIGWICTRELEDRVRGGRGDMRRDVTLMAAVAMSGAAVSPAMGKMSRPAYRMLLTLINARLGVWLPNPRYSRASEGEPCVSADPTAGMGDRPTLDRVPGVRAVREWKHATTGQPPAGPRNRPGLAWLFREMLGLMSIRARRIYVTDGGHYENLGLIELLRRKCTLIYCFDASGDEPDSFTTLAQTLALARSDLNVDIPADPQTLREQMRATRTNGRPQGRQSHVVIPFRYTKDAKVVGRNLEDGVTPADGVLIYVKCRVTGSAPWDVRALYERDDAFPDHSTADQLYTEERLEAYRALGAHLAGEAVADPAALGYVRPAVRRNGAVAAQ